MRVRTLWMLGAMALGAMLFVSLGAVAAQDEVPLADKEALGKAIFFDDNLSINMNQSCASCHGTEVGFTGPDSAINAGGSVYEGSVLGRFGDRKPPSAAYATQSPIFHVDKKGTWIGGNFWDGRATGEVLGNPAADQALGPFLNPVEQALPDSACVVYRVTEGAYGDLFQEVWDEVVIAWPSDVEAVCATEGSSVALSDSDRTASDEAYGWIGLSIAAYEASPEVNAFTSKLDLNVKLDKDERRGWALFNGKAGCSACHPGNGQKPLFTDYTFDNLGVPSNPENPVYRLDSDFVDPGLGGFLKTAGYSEDVYDPEWGKHKVPTLRNVARNFSEGDEIVKAFTHNGYFKTLEGLVHFYNTRDVLDVCPGIGATTFTEAEALDANCWPAPEVAANVNTEELGDLGLSADEEAAVVAFMKALSDGYGQ
jgi:cytochrome c peroxidase